MEIRTRFAPSPTGFMHIGNLRTALYAYLFAKKNKGKFVLRIEDTDTERFVEGAIEKIFATLKKVGIVHDEGPDVGGEYGPYIQSQRKDIYLKYAEKLIECGGAYYCFCDKERLDGLADEKGIKRYDKKCLHLSAQEIQQKLHSKTSYVIRQNMPLEGESSYTDLVYGKISVPNSELEDNILIKSDGMPTYNFANVVDDHLMNINFVIRGTEYLSSTPKYNHIYDSFGWNKPQYIHLPHIMKDAQRKLSKRYGDANFEDFIAKGYLPAAVLNYIALLGWSPKGNQEKLSMEELIEMFDIDGISKSSSIFDEQKMKWLNSQYLKELSFEEFNQLALPYYEEANIKDKYDNMLLSQMLQNRIEILSEIIEKVDFLQKFENFDLALYEHKKMKTDVQIAKIAIEAAQAAFKGLKAQDFDHDKILETLTNKSEEIEIKKRQMLYCIRVALTGKEVTPGGAIEIAELLGKDECIARLQKSLEWLEKQ